MSVRICRAVLALACVAALAQAAQTRPRPHGRKQPRLYHVTDGRGRHGFIDRTGRLRIGFDLLPAGAMVSDFSEGLAAVCVRDDKGYCKGAGYIDETGAFAIPMRFKVAQDFKEGLAFVRTDDGGAGYINRRGELVFKLTDRYAFPFSDGLAMVGLYGSPQFIDRTGKVVIRGSYRYAEPFSEGLAAAVLEPGRTGRYGFIDKTGRVVIPARFQPVREHHGFIRSLGRFSEGFAAVQVGNNSYGFADRKGDLVIPAQFSYTFGFSEGLACVASAAGGWGFIDRKGRWAVARGPRFSQCGSFKEGLAPVAFKTGGVYDSWGYVDRGGRVVIGPRFSWAAPFEGGVARVYVVKSAQAAAGGTPTQGWGYIDRSGKFIWGPRWD